MKNLLSVFARNSMARDYAIASVVICVLGVLAVEVITRLVASTKHVARVQQASIAPQREESRTYQVSRSVLDDTVITGSIGGAGTGRPVILDPCTGTVKSR